MLMKKFLIRAICKMKSLSIKNSSTYYPPVKLVNLIDFDPKKVKNKCSRD